MPAVESNVPPTGCSISVSEDGVDSRGVHRVVVVGELDLLTSPQLLETLTSLLAVEQTQRVILDLTGVTFFDSSALNVLLHAHREAGERKVSLVIAPSRQVQRVIDLTGVTSHLELAE